VSSKDFQIALTPGRVLRLQLIQAAIGAGVAALTAVAVFGFPPLIPHDKYPPSREDLETVRDLSIAGLSLAILCWLLSTGLYYSLLRAARAPVPDQQEGAAPTPAGRCFFRIRRAIVLSLLPVGAAAIFGLAVLVFASAEKQVLWAAPRVYFNAVPAVFFLLHVIFTFPTYARLELIFERKVAGPYRFEPGDQLVVRFVREGVATVVTASPEKAKEIYEHLRGARGISGDGGGVVARASFKRESREMLSFKITSSGAIVMDGEIYAGTEDIEALARQAAEEPGGEAR